MQRKTFAVLVRKLTSKNTLNSLQVIVVSGEKLANSLFCIKHTFKSCKTSLVALGPIESVTTQSQTLTRSTMTYCLCTILISATTLTEPSNSRWISILKINSCNQSVSNSFLTVHFLLADAEFRQAILESLNNHQTFSCTPSETIKLHHITKEYP